MKSVSKRIAMILMVIVMLCTAVTLLVACGDQSTGEQGPQGAVGPQGPQGEAGAPGADGTKWFTGRGLPTDQQLDGVKAGDFYINLNTNTVYVKGSETWSILVNVNEKNNVSKWDGRIPGWQAPNLSDEQVIANRPVSYVVNETAKTVDLYNAEAFAWFAYRAVIGKQGYKDYTVNLHCDVDLDNQMWVPIGLGARSNAEYTPFMGTFNGNGHTIYNLNGTKFAKAIQFGNFTDGITGNPVENGFYIHYVNGSVDVNIPLLVNDDREIPYGLFGTTSNATIKNLNIENIQIEFPPKQYAGDEHRYKDGDWCDYSLLADSVGALIGFARGNLTLENIRTGKVGGGDYIKGTSSTAGMVGRAYAGSSGDGKKGPYGNIVVENCVNYVDITGVVYGDEENPAMLKNSNDKTAGIVAFPRAFKSLTVRGCENYGKITGYLVGGIIGASQGGEGNDISVLVRVEDCNNYGNLVSNSIAGGIIGQRSSGSNAMFVITDCNNYGQIDAIATLEWNKDPAKGGNNRYMGGIVGLFNVKASKAIMQGCNNFADITAKEFKLTGGYLVGLLSFDANATGKVTVNSCMNAGTLVYDGSDTKYQMLQMTSEWEHAVGWLAKGGRTISASEATNYYTQHSFMNIGTVEELATEA